MLVVYLLLSVFVSFCSSQCSSADYALNAVDSQGNFIQNCSFTCCEINCEKVALMANACLNREFILFESMLDECQLFNSRRNSSTTYTVFAVDENLDVIDGTPTVIHDYFNEAIDFGCGFLTLVPDAVLFGLSFD